MSTRSKLYDQFAVGTFALLTDVQIAAKLHAKRSEIGLVREILHALCDEGKLVHDRNYRYGTPEQFHAIQGTVNGNEKGFGFFIPDDRTLPDLFLPHAALQGAMHKDRVWCICVGGKKGDEGEVLGIIERGYTEIVGTFVRDNRAGYLIPDDGKYFEKIYIPLKSCKGIRPNVKAIARITEYPDGRMPGGEIVEVLGADDDFFVEELSIIRSYHLREEFPEEVVEEAQRVSSRPLVYDGREDFRGELIVTIDGEDTRDIDDAISVSFDGTYYTLGVHIADVSEYVRPKSALDKEALERGTSVYFPDRVLPMLPKALSNGICSLNEGVDRLALSCILTIDKTGGVVKKRITKSVISSTHRMTYHQVDKILNGEKEACAKFADVVPMLETARDLTNLLSGRRRARGNVELDVREAKIYMDEQSNIVIPDHEELFSYGLIEQFMVLANEGVATFLAERQLPCVYRVHENPSPEKAEQFLLFARECGLEVSFDPEHVTPKEYQAILDRAEGLPVAPVVHRVMLRSMQKAKYSPVNVGHFGLASDCYCHFTSPIRRYPDLCVHRIVKTVLDGGDTNSFLGFVPRAAEQSSECERNAAEAEREVDDLYKVQYMSDHIGEEYDAVISGVTSFGIFAELANTVEGILPIETLPADDYEFVQEKFLLKGRTHAFRIGDSVRIRVEACHFDSYRVEFSLLPVTKS
ncbi:MAG: ribonuclease R [Christensenellaceae bacterium]